MCPERVAGGDIDGFTPECVRLPATRSPGICVHLDDEPLVRDFKHSAVAGRALLPAKSGLAQHPQMRTSADPAGICPQRPVTHRP